MNTLEKTSFIIPYTSSNDDRLTCLKDVFLQYLENWKKSMISREGKYSADERQKLFLSQQTYEGLKISVYSHIKAITFLLAEGFEYVLTKRFMQDVLEDYFGPQRNKGRDQTTRQRSNLGTMI